MGINDAWKVLEIFLFGALTILNAFSCLTEWIFCSKKKHMNLPFYATCILSLKGFELKCYALMLNITDWNTNINSPIFFPFTVMLVIILLMFTLKLCDFQICSRSIHRSKHPCAHVTAMCFLVAWHVNSCNDIITVLRK